MQSPGWFELFSPFCAPGRSKSPPSMIRRVFLSLPGTGARYDLSAILRSGTLPVVIQRRNRWPSETLVRYSAQLPEMRLQIRPRSAQGLPPDGRTDPPAFKTAGFPSCDSSSAAGGRFLADFPAAFSRFCKTQGSGLHNCKELKINHCPEFKRNYFIISMI